MDFVLDRNFDFASTLCYKRTTININHGSNTEQIMWGVKQYGGECMPISVLTENVQSSSCIIRWHEIRYRRSSEKININHGSNTSTDYVGCQTIWWGVYANLSIDWKCSELLLYRIKTRATWRSSSVPKKVSHGGDGTGCGSPLYVCRPQSTSDTEVNICQCQA